MGKINVVLPGGRVVSVDEDVAAQSRLPVESVAGAEQRESDTARDNAFGGVGGAVSEAFVSAGDTLSLGGLGAAANAIGGDTMQRARQNSVAEHPGAHVAGEVAGLLMPTGVLGSGLRGASELTGLGLAARAGEAAGELGGKYVGRGVEGAIYGVGGRIADTNVTGDPLTIESVISSAGLGALLNVGVGALTDRIGGGIERAAEHANIAENEAKTLRADIPEATKGAGLGLTKDAEQLPSWTDFREAHTAAQEAAAEYNTAAAKEAAAYDKFAGSNSKLGKALHDAQEAISTVRNRYAAEASRTQWIEGAPRAEMTGYDAEGNPARILTNQKPPISDAIRQQLDGYSARLTEAMMTKQGGKVLERGRWVSDPSVPPDPRAALEKLRTLQTDFMGAYGQASRKMADLPALPRAPMPASEVVVPKTLGDFTRMHPETVARLTNGMDATTKQAFSRLSADIGLPADANPADVHAALKKYAGAIDRVQTASAKQTAKEASRPAVIKLLNKAAKFSIARATDVGGWMGAVTRTVGGEVGGRALSAVESAALDGAMVESKLGVRSRIRELIANNGIPAANAVKKLPSVAAGLSTSFPDGKPDTAKDMRERAVNRIHDITMAAHNAPDTAFAAIQGLLGHPNDVGFKLHQHIVGTLQYLYATLPRDPGTDVHVFKSNWTPSYHDSVALAHRLEAVQDPITAIARAIAGDSHPAATEALWATYPQMMNELSAEFAAAAPQMQKLTPQQASSYSMLFRTPMTGLNQPIVAMTIQSLYLPKPPPPQSGSGGQSGGPGGRPPAVQSQVAGSSVAGLISR